ncbi:MAG TPA: hypothetical protein VLS27_02655 [Gammaproteobacteria bacterium]|nr:hypothetical protein [Gammaproteobacteria bacterium]
MHSTRKSSGTAETTSTQRRDEIISILAGGLIRIVRGGDAAPSTPTYRPDSIPRDAGAVTIATGWADIHGRGLASMHDEKLSESGENGLELSGETRLSVVAG